MGEAVEMQQDAEDAGARKLKRGTGVGEDDDEEEVADVEAESGGAGKEDLLMAEKAEEEDGSRYEGIAEEAVAEVMRWLEAEIAAPGTAAAAAAGSVTINGNEGESCGPSVSAAASTVMASVDTRAGAPPPPRVPWPWPECPHAAGIVISTKDADDGAAGMKRTGGDAEMGLGGGGEAAEEEWLVRLLSCGGPLLEGVL